MSAIKIKLTKVEKSEDSFSHLFGAPILPESLMDEINELDTDVMFFGQFDLSELAPLDTENKLPHSGYLYLFLDTAGYPYEVRVFYSTDEPKYVVDEFNSEVPEFEKFVVPFAMAFECCEEDTEGTKLFGKPSWEWNRDEELFMQFDPLDNDTGFLFHVDGYACFIFGDKERTLEKLRFVIDQS